jgi:hypothetical protein
MITYGEILAFALGVLATAVYFFLATRSRSNP